jgi:Flp pilus assembly protein TadD
MQLRSSNFWPTLVLLIIIAALAQTDSGQAYTNTKVTSPVKRVLNEPRPAARTDPSLSIDPTSVSNLSDEELNTTFDTMNSNFSKNAVLYNNIGATFYQRKVYDKAEEALRRAIAATNHPAFLTNLSILYDTEGRTVEAIAMAQRAVTQSPQYVRGRHQLCELMLVSSRMADTMLCYDELAKIDRLDDLALTYYSIALIKSGDFDKAITILSPIVQGQQPTALSCGALGMAYYKKKRFDRAVGAFKQGVEIDPDSARLRYNLAMALTARNDRAGALAQYSLMKEKDPSLADQLYRALYRDKLVFVNEAETKKK